MDEQSMFVSPAWLSGISWQGMIGGEIQVGGGHGGHGSRGNRGQGEETRVRDGVK